MKYRPYIWFAGACMSVVIVAGCVPAENDLDMARRFSASSRANYTQAVEVYRELIGRGENPDVLHFELGRLYYENGRFYDAIEELKQTKHRDAWRFLAVSYYYTGGFTDALEVFGKNEALDEEYLYYYGLTCEKLNLFDKALKIYKSIKEKPFLQPAQERINLIERKSVHAHIKDVNPHVYELLNTAPSSEEYPQAGALILYVNEKIEITAQQTEVSSLHYLVKIINERGKDKFSEIKIDYDSTYEKVDLEYARTIRPDGSVVEVGSKHIRDVSKYLNFPLYSNARVRIISFPAISEGASIEYKIKITRNKLMSEKDFIMSYPVQASEPIIAAYFDLIVPAQDEIMIKAINEMYNTFGADLDPEIESLSPGTRQYHWEFKNIPQIIPESNMPPGVEINPIVLISSFKDWREIYDWWWELAKDKIKADASIKNKVNEIISRLDSDEAKMKAIYNFCAQKIRYVAVEYGEAGYEPHQAEDIFRNKYGDCKDQAILLVTMLKEAHFSAWPVLIATRRYYNLDEEFPAPFFNHCIAAVRLGEEIIFLDPTAETCAFTDLPVSDQGRNIFLIKEDGYEIVETPVYPAEHNLLRQSFKITVNSDESISAEKNIATYGIYDQIERYWLLYTQPQLVRETIEEKIQSISIGAKLKDYVIENIQELGEPILLSYTFSGPEYFIAAGRLRIVPQLAYLDTSLVAKDSRRYPIDFDVLNTKETVFKIFLPEGMRVKYVPPDITRENPWVKLTVKYDCRGRELDFIQRMELKKKIISPRQYRDFKIFLEKAAQMVKQRMVLEKK